MSYPGYPPYTASGGQPGGYPGQSPYPPGSSPYPGGQPSPYPPQPGYSAGQPGGQPYPQSGYPPQPGYPSQPGFPTPSPAYQAAAGYPQSAYSSQPSYPGSQYPATTAYPPTTTGYPAQQSYPASMPQPHTGTPAYPSMPGAGMTMPSGPGYSVPPQSYPSGYATSSVPAQMGTPTLRPFPSFDARMDAEILRKAMKGFGTDEDSIINVLTKRSNQQRVEIATMYKSMYGKDLIDNLKSELSGKLEDCMVSLVLPRFDFYAKEIHHALSFTNFRSESVAEIICSSTNEEIRQIKAAYERMFSKPLEQKIRDDLSGDFKRLLISLCQARRDESSHVNPASSTADAQALYSAGELKWGTDESVFNSILTNRSYPHLNEVFREYNCLTGRDIEASIHNEFSSDIKFGLLAIVKCVRNKHDFFAEQLRDSIAGAGTNDRALIRIIVARCEIDLGDIKRVYFNKYGTSLESSIERDTSGDYRKALLSLAS